MTHKLRLTPDLSLLSVRFLGRGGSAFPQVAHALCSYTNKKSGYAHANLVLVLESEDLELY